MPTALTLEDFGTPRSAGAESGAAPSEADMRAAFERGYRDGWKDATAAQEDQQGRISDDFAANLRDLSFTFHEARVHVLQGLQPFLREIVEKLLPEIARTTLPELVGERMDELLRSAADRPVEIAVAPASRGALERLLPADPGFPLVIAEEPSLPEGQVYITAGRREFSVNADAVISEIGRMVDDYFNLAERKQAHG